MIQRQVYDPLLITSKSAELLSLTAISGIILRTEHGEQSTAEYLCCNALNDYTQEPTRFIYTSQQSVFQDEQHKALQEYNKIMQSEKIQVEYKKEIERLKTLEIEKLQISRSLSTNVDIGEKLQEAMKARNNYQKKKGQLKCSLQLMFIHLNRSHGWILRQNKLLQKEFLQKIKKSYNYQKGINIISKILDNIYASALGKIKKQQKVKKVTIKTTKVLEIQDILRRQMQKYKKKDLKDDKICSKKVRGKIVRFI